MISRHIRHTAFSAAFIGFCLVAVPTPSFARKVCVKPNGQIVTKRKCSVRKGEEVLDVESINALVVTADGTVGEQGSQGVQGERGATGPQGPAGTPGSIGPAGATGSQGAQGPAGLQGIQGIPGPQGERGRTGTQGAQGIPGPQGETGDGIEAHTLHLGSGSGWSFGNQFSADNVTIKSIGSIAYLTPITTGPNRQVTLPFSAPDYMKIKDLTVCYSTSNPRSYIDDTFLTRTIDNTSRFAVIFDSTERDSTTFGCYTSTPSFLQTISGSLSVELKIVFGDLADEIVIGRVSVSLEPA